MSVLAWQIRSPGGNWLELDNCSHYIIKQFPKSAIANKFELLLYAAKQIQEGNMARQWSERKINFHLTLLGVNWSVKIWGSIPATEGNCSCCPEGQNCGNSWFFVSQPK